jgi:hypothetical protein
LIAIADHPLVANVDPLHLAMAANAPPLDVDALAGSLAALDNAIAQLSANTAPRTTTPLLDPFVSTAPFDLSSCAGATAYSTAAAALDSTWDGTPEQLPSFLIALRIRAAKVHWGAADPQGILAYGAHQLLTDHHSITAADLETARTTRTDPRTLQNAKALYECLKKSITGDLRATLFDQASNLPVHPDGPTFFKSMLSFTNVSSLQLSIISFNQILQFDPALCKFAIPTVNTKLNQLFLLATTSSRTLGDAERIQHTLTVYQRIRQLEIWAQWVRNQVDAFEEGKILSSQTFMNAAAIKYNKICVESDGQDFPGSATTLQEDIVAMVAATKRKHLPGAPPEKGKPTPSNNTNDDRKKLKQPPFVKHYKSSVADGDKAFKVGDTKVWNKATWHFCDCPNHRHVDFPGCWCVSVFIKLIRN